jgi:two-component system cell cycle sensor histidine kinase/response regulator CckA
MSHGQVDEVIVHFRTIVIAVLICVFSVAASQAVDPQNKGQAAVRRSLKTIIVDNYQPYTFMNEKGSPDGFSVEIVKAVAKVMDLDLEIRAGTWEQATKELERGTIDLLPMMAYSVERDKTFDFSVPHTIAYDAIFHRSGDKSLGSLKDLSGKTVIVMNKDAAHDYLLMSGLSKTMRLQLVDSLPEALRQLASGKGDAAIMPKLVGIITLRKLNLSNIDPSPSVIDSYSRPFSFAVKEGDQALLERLNQGLGILKTTGQYDAIYKKWFGALEGPNIPWKSALQLISLAGIVLIAFAAWNVSLKHQVKSRTKDLEAEVAERKLKAEALRESEERYATILRTATDGFWVTDRKGQFLEVNDAICRNLGYSRDELLRMSVSDIDAVEKPEEILQAFQRIMERGSDRFEGLHRCKDGSLRNEEINVNYLPPPHDRFFAFLHDITERKRAVKALGESERKYRLLVANAHEAIFIAQEEVVKFPNPKALEMTGYSTEELAGVPFTDLIHPEDRGKILERHIERLRGGTPPETYPFRIMGKTGEEIWVQFTAVLIDWEGKPGVLCFLRDLTKERNLEAQFMQAQKMEAVGRLAGGIAHDFNNLLTVTIGYCDLALARIGALDPLRHDLEEIRKASDRCTALTRQILAFSRKQILVPKVINLGDVVTDMDKMLRRLIGEDIDLVSVRGKDLWNVKADPGQIEQVIVNLVVNSRDAMPPGGKLTIETSNVVLDETYVRGHKYVSPGSYVMLAVSDTGRGMDAGTLARIFEPFFTTKEQGKGTGLGLSTVYGIVKQSGGHINVYSEPGIGTTFKMYFPHVEETVTDLSRAAALPSEELRGSETVLVVEDEDLVREMVREILEQYGYTVLEARSGGEAVDLCSRHHGAIHMMLTDVVMPGMNGVELSKRLAPMKLEMKVLFMSGYTTHAALHQGILEPGVAFIHKPFSMDSLAHKVREVLDTK